MRSALEAENGDLLFLVASDKPQVVFDTLAPCGASAPGRWESLTKAGPIFCGSPTFLCLNTTRRRAGLSLSIIPSPTPRRRSGAAGNHPGAVRARAYDMVLNGNEVGGGSIRINDPALQQRMFKALGFTQEEAQERFGFLIDAFRYGARLTAAWPSAWTAGDAGCWGCDSIRGCDRLSQGSQFPAS